MEDKFIAILSPGFPQFIFPREVFVYFFHIQNIEIYALKKVS